MAVIVTQVKDGLDGTSILCNDDFCYRIPDPLVRLNNEDNDGGVEGESERMADKDEGAADVADGGWEDGAGGDGEGGREGRRVAGGEAAVQGEDPADVDTRSDATCPELLLLRHGEPEALPRTHLFPIGSPATPSGSPHHHSPHPPPRPLESPSALALCLHAADLPSLPFFSPFIAPPPPLENAEVAMHRRVMQEIANLTAHLEGDPGNAHLLLERGRAWYSIHRFPEAVADRKQAVAILEEPSAAHVEPHSSGSNGSNGSNGRIRGNHHHPSDLPRALLSLGQALHAAGRVQEAVEANERAATLIPSQNLTSPATSAAATSAEDTSAAASSAEWVTASAAWGMVGLSYHWLPDADSAERAFRLAVEADPRNPKAYKHWAMHRQMTGDLKGTIALLTKWFSLAPRTPKAHLTLGCCRQALGHIAHAVSAFTRIIDAPSDPEDAPILFHAFYQREIAILTAMHLDSSFSDFSIEGAFSTKFLNHWAYKKDPRNLFPGYAMLPQAAAFAPRRPPRRAAEEDERERERVVRAADLIGRRVQYSSVGNVVNRRAVSIACWGKNGGIEGAGEGGAGGGPDWAAGMAALEVMQSARAHSLLCKSFYSSSPLFTCHHPPFTLLFSNWQHRATGMAALEVMQSARATWRRWARRKQKHGLTEGRRAADPRKSEEEEEEDEEDEEEEEDDDEEEEEGVGMVVDGWRGVFGIGARWRQLVDPCEPVLWMEMVRSVDPSLVGNSVTPISVFRQLTTKYADYYNRTLAVLKGIMQQQHHVFANGDDQRIPLSERDCARVEAAATEYDLFDIVGQSFFVVTPCHSATTPGVVLNGTEILIREVSSHYSLELSIRTTRHVDRIDQLDRELGAAWEHLCGLMADRIRTGGGTGGHGGRAVEAAILRVAYFWYQAMPLSRGTAVVGYATLLGLFLAAGKGITASIPPRMQ
ncbi:unnamed protein product, partial [Closterium sp. Naga37s-1]